MLINQSDCRICLSYSLTVDRMLGAEFNSSLKRLSDGLSANWDRSYSATMYWILSANCLLLISGPLIYNVCMNVCLRGSRTKWKGIGVEDGSGTSHPLPGL